MHCKVLHCTVVYVEDFNKSILLYNLFVEGCKVLNYDLCPVMLVLRSVELLCLQENILLMEIDFLGKNQFIIH